MIQKVDKLRYLQIGVQGDNDAMTVEIDMSEWAYLYPKANFFVLFKPYNDTIAYPQPATYSADTMVLEWTISMGATAVAGVGYTEIRAQNPETGMVKKTRIIPTSVENSVSGVSTDPPAGQQEWVTIVLNSAAAVLAAAHGKQVKFEIDSETGHLMLCYSDDETVTVDTEWTEVDLGPVDAYAMAVQNGYSGTAEQFAQYMADIVNGAASAAASAAEAAQHTSTAVHEWLDENIDVSTGYALDRTLSEPLEAAPADLVGNLKNALATLTLPVVPAMINGQLDAEGNAINIGETDRWITQNYIPTEYLKDLENNTSGGKTYIDYYNYTNGSYVFTEYVTTNPETVTNIDKTKGTHIRLYSTHASSGRNVVLNQYISTLKDIQDTTALNAENIENLDEGSMIYRGVAPDNEQNLLSYLLDIGIYVTRAAQTWTDAPFEEVIALVNFQPSNNYITQVAFTWNGEIAFRFVHKTNHTAYTGWNKIGESAAIDPPRDGKYDVVSVNHRGYNTVAPENTLPAYRLSAQHGFKFVETDIQLTKPGDDVLVCIHDSTINRTSDGTGNVNSFTYDELLQYDFGSWKSATYTGTKIPTYEEFLELCRNLGLYPYVELKQEFTQEQIQTILDITSKYGFTEGKISFVSAYYNDLVYVKNLNKKMRLGYIYNGDATAEKIADAVALKSGMNNVALLVDYKDLTNDGIQRCIAAKIPLEIWTADTETVIKGLDPYITGVTSNVLHAGEVLFNANKGDENGLIT